MLQAGHVEQYEFYCEPCNYTWLTSYQVRADPGGQLRFSYLHGLPATPPAAGRLCPNCWAPSFSSRKLDEPLLARAGR